MKKTILLFLLISIFSFAQKAELKREIHEITKGKNATIAISVKGINFPFTYNNKNAKKKLPMLSVFKFHIALTVLDLVDKGKLNLEQKIVVKKSDLLENTWSPFREKYPNGNIEVTLDEMIFYSVSLSDNNITDVLLNLIGGTATVQKFMNQNKVKTFQIKYNEKQMHNGAEFLYANYTSTKSLSKLYKNFYLGKILSQNSTDYLYEILLKTNTGSNKIKEQLPDNTVAHKTGASGTDENGCTIAENDSGIVTLSNGKKYAISIFVNNSKEERNTNNKMISNISKVVYNSLNK